MNRTGMDNSGSGLIEVISQNIPGGIGENHENLKDSQFPGHKHLTNIHLDLFRKTNLLNNILNDFNMRLKVISNLRIALPLPDFLTNLYSLFTIIFSSHRLYMSSKVAK
jgi:hypothetical protein